MDTLFFSSNGLVYIVQTTPLDADALERLRWLLQAELLDQSSLTGCFIGPRREMITPWSTNATEMTVNMGICGVSRMECFEQIDCDSSSHGDPMLQAFYQGLSRQSLLIMGVPEPTVAVTDIRKFNVEHGLALSEEEVAFLQHGAEKLGRKLTDCEVFGFAQINSEHCRHKIFNGTFILDGVTQEKSLFSLIKETSKKSPEQIVSAYRDNVAFLKGPKILQFAPDRAVGPGYFSLCEIPTVISIKAETHNFPTTVEPFNGASTGSGGEIRDRMAGGRGSIPLVGSAVYMTAYPRLSENGLRGPEARKWKFQTPAEILIKASNGASDFGNKFGQPLIVGSLFTFEMETKRAFYAYDRCIMLAGGVGYAHAEHATKGTPAVGDKVLLLGGDNYRIGMAGSSVSSVDSGAYSKEIELSAVQRSNPEMQKRVYNVIRSLAQLPRNPIKSIHDHGAGGHLNCLSELLEPNGGTIELSKLPVGDPTLSVREILCNESQERMGLVVSGEDVEAIAKIAERERAPLYVVGEIGDSGWLAFADRDGKTPFQLPMKLLFGGSPKSVIAGETISVAGPSGSVRIENGTELLQALKEVLSLEGVACKDWLTNKVDRSVTGLIARQQCVGPLQLPLSNLGIVSLDYQGTSGIAQSIGHAPAAALIDERAGSVLSIAEALTNIVWAPLEKGLESVALSANWMWPAKRPGEDVRLYRAVEAVSRFAIELGIAIPTGKDSLSMTMSYHDGSEVRAPGTVIISAAGVVSDIRRCVTPELIKNPETRLLYVNLSGQKEHPLGGSALYQARGLLGESTPTVKSSKVFKECFQQLQQLISSGTVLSGHDVSSGGVITTLCEMAFAGNSGLEISYSQELADFLFSEKPAVVIQVGCAEREKVIAQLTQYGAEVFELAKPLAEREIRLVGSKLAFQVPLSELLRSWFAPSCLFDSLQVQPEKAVERFDTLEQRALQFTFPKGFTGRASDYGIDLHRKSVTGLQAAIVREKGTNGDREMAFSLFAAGFDVKDVAMSDLLAGTETLEDISFIVFPGGFANSDVLGAGRGWGGSIRYNKNVRTTLGRFFERPDTLSLGVCNGCQLMAVLELLYPEYPRKIETRHNESKKFESAFLAVDIGQTESVLLKPLVGSRLGIWVAHGEGRFSLPEGEQGYDIALRYVSSKYPENPTGSEFNAAGITSRDGRHLMMMPHLERAILPWQWGFYPDQYWPEGHQVSPWMLAFVGARECLRKQS